MNFLQAKNRHSINKTALNLSSMIDVTFLLLIYFIVTTVFTPPESSLSPALKLEEGIPSQEQDFEPQIVNVQLQNGIPVYLLGGQVMFSRIDFTSVISKLPIDPGLIIRVHDDVPVGFAITAVQEARNVGFERVTYVPAVD
ncbi:MAG: biopolymer transporter ExbD [Phycisphaerae bacterium]|nr:biopolymer transporter ExbD [Phycisphaerae bacterium]